jgi:hypothetical protein
MEVVIHEHERRDLNSVLALELRQLRTHDVPHVQNRKVEELAVIGKRPVQMAQLKLIKDPQPSRWPKAMTLPSR